MMTPRQLIWILSKWRTLVAHGLSVPRVSSLRLSLEELYEASGDRPLFSPEIYKNNDFYGNAVVLKQYAQFPRGYQIKAAIEHGPYLGDFVWGADLRAPVPALLFPAPVRYSILRKRTGKALFAIGPMLSYAHHFLNSEALGSERKRLGKNLLAFPVHSSHRVNAVYDVRRYCEFLSEIGKNFDNVRICLYWKDVLRGLAEEFMKFGFECVTAGHMFDPYFLPRLKSIIELATVATSNEHGTQLGFCISMGKPFYLTKEQVRYTAKKRSMVLQDGYDPDRKSRLWYQQIQSLFSELRPDITDEQRQFVDRHWGSNHKKTSEEIRLLLQLTEDMYRMGPQFFPSSKNALPTYIDDSTKNAGDTTTLANLNGLSCFMPEISSHNFRRSVALEFLAKTRDAGSLLLSFLRGPSCARARVLLAALQSLPKDFFLQTKSLHLSKGGGLHKTDDERFDELFKIIQSCTKANRESLYSLFCQAKHICDENLPGNFIDFSAGDLGGAIVLASVVKHFSIQPRWVHTLSLQNPFFSHDQDRFFHTREDAGLKKLIRRLRLSSLKKHINRSVQSFLTEKRQLLGMVALVNIGMDDAESLRVAISALYDQLVRSSIVHVYGQRGLPERKQVFTDIRRAKDFRLEPNIIDKTGFLLRKLEAFPSNPGVPPELIKRFNSDDPVRGRIISQMSTNERFQLYYVLCKHVIAHSPPLRFVEIGSHSGASLLIMYYALKRTFGNLQGFAVEPAGLRQFYGILRLLQNEIVHLRVFSHDAANVLKERFRADCNFPMVILLDGDHSYNGVCQDILDFFPLLAPGGIMIFHDYLPPLDDKNREAILLHHGGREPGIRQACEELMENNFRCEPLALPLLFPTDPTQTQSHFPIIPGVFSTLRAYKKPLL